MNDIEFRAVLDWWMCSDPMHPSVPSEVINDWLTRESQQRGYESTPVAYHEHPRQ